jgi:type II secretory pathway pseudopilin PulG
VVIAIIAILAAVVVPNLFSLTTKAKEASAKSMANTIVSAVVTDRASKMGTGADMYYTAPDCATVIGLLGADITADWGCKGPGVDGGYVTVPATTIKFSLTADPSFQIFYYRPDGNVADDGTADEETYIVTYRYESEGGTAMKAGGTFALAADADGIP